MSSFSLPIHSKAAVRFMLTALTVFTILAAVRFTLTAFTVFTILMIGPIR